MKIENLVPIQPNLINTGDAAQSLDVGDVFRAKIIAITTNELVLKLMDGSQTKALSAVPPEFSVGNFVDFEVKNVDNGVLTICPTKEKTEAAPKQTELETALATLNKEPEPQTVQIVKALLDNNIRVTQESFNNLSETVKNFKAENLTPQKAIFLIQNDVPITKENVQTLNSFISKEFNIVNTFSDLTKKLSNLDETQLTDVSNKLTLLESFEKLSTVLSKVSNVATQSNESIDIEKVINNNIKELLKNPDFFAKLGNIDIKTLKDVLLKDIPLNILQNSKTLLPTIQTETENVNEKGNGNEPPKIISDDQAVVTKRNEIAKRVFEGCFVKLKDDISVDDLDVKELYKKILLRLSILKEAVSNSHDVQASDIQNSIANFDKQLNFTNSINSNHTYVQIPINYEGQKNGELYIIKKKQSKSDDNAGTSVFLSLNTINIGRFETLVNIKDKKLKINIRLEHDELINFVKNNYNLIYNLLDKTDFKIVDIKCKKIDEEINPINIESEIKNEFFGNTKSMDIKI